jgi:hypothetical protein
MYLFTVHYRYPGPEGTMASRSGVTCNPHILTHLLAQLRAEGHTVFRARQEALPEAPSCQHKNIP